MYDAQSAGYLTKADTAGLVGDAVFVITVRGALCLERGIVSFSIVCISSFQEGQGGSG
jgi:hypothetical protein